MDLKALKAELKKKTDKNPEKYYAVDTLKKKGFHRQKCIKCGKYFWTAGGDNFCGSAECSGGYGFIGKSPAKKKMDFIQVWKEFSKIFKKLGYNPIKRYPVVARWRDDVYWTNASIYDFQPHVVSGEVEPPANPLVVPQPCIRFNDIDNVGITGSHYTGFVMIGQHAFLPKEKFNINQYLADIFTWLEKGMGLKKEELKFHEDQWGGGGNLGVCMEFFCRGLEIGNQVYITYDVKGSSYRELNLKILDMGMGQERPSWLSHGTDTSYEANFPTVADKLYNITGVKPTENLLRKFLPYSGLLNMDEIENIDKVWADIGKKLGMDVKELKENVLPLAAIYSIGDHTRTLLFAISDGAIPSNVGGCYNLRVLLRRMFDFMKTYEWDVDLAGICELHSKYLKPQYPELGGYLEEIKKIIDLEKQRYEQTREKSKRLVGELLKKGITEKKLLELYDSQGISPEFLQEEANKNGKVIDVPDDFYANVAALHKEVEKETKKEMVQWDLIGIPETEKLYYKQDKKLEFKAKVLKVLNKKYVILDKTQFYPTGGGQPHDTGTLNKIKVLNVLKSGNRVVHELEKPGIKQGMEVSGKVDKNRREQLAKNHTAAHIIGGAARKVLGKHVWQAGSHIDLNKGRLDVTHYKSIEPGEIAQIEKLANKVIKEKRRITKKFMDRNAAEQKFGFTLYQGGAVPGKSIRVMDIQNWDTQACGGTHLDSTGEAEGIRIVKTEKIQDGVARIVFVAGKELLEEKEKGEVGIAGQCMACVQPFLGKEKLKGVSSTELELSAKVFSVQPEQLPKTLERFVDEVCEMQAKLKEAGQTKLEEDFCAKIWRAKGSLPEICRVFFQEWKSLNKEIRKQEAGEVENIAKELLGLAREVKEIRVVFRKLGNFRLVMQIANKLISENSKLMVLLSAENRTVCAFSPDLTAKWDAKETLNMLIPKGEVSGNAARAVANKPLGLSLDEILEKLI